jgi:hypothetical protein
VDTDYDEWLRTLIEPGLEQAVSRFTPEQLAELEEKAEDIASATVSHAIEATTKGMVERLKADAPGMLEHRRTWQTDVEHVGVAGNVSDDPLQRLLPDGNQRPISATDVGGPNFAT